MGGFGGGWEADEDDFGIGEEEVTDMGDEPSQPSAPVTPSNTATASSTPKHNGKPGKQGRPVRVKRMPAGMKSKWPDVVSCLFTLNSGKQILLVRG